MLTYWEAKGETFKELDKLLDERDIAIKELIAWAERQGGQLGYSDATMGGFSAALRVPSMKYENGTTHYPAPSIAPENWKQASKHEPTEYWKPRLSTKEGRRLADQLRKMELKVPSKSEIVKLTGMQLFGKNLSINSIQVYRLRKKKKVDRILLVITQDDYDPKKINRKEKPNLTRISDLEFEKVCKSVLKKDAIL